MPCDQICTIQSLVVRAENEAVLKKVAESVAKQRNGTYQNYGLGIIYAENVTVQMQRDSANRLIMQGIPGATFDAITTDVTMGLADQLLIKAMRNVGFVLSDTRPMVGSLKREMGDGVEHTYTSIDGMRTVTIGRARNGRLHFDMGKGYSQYEAQDLVNTMLDAMRTVGIQVDDVTIREHPEDWLEERLPNREAE